MEEEGRRREGRRGEGREGKVGEGIRKRTPHSVSRSPSPLASQLVSLLLLFPFTVYFQRHRQSDPDETCQPVSPLCDFHLTQRKNLRLPGACHPEPAL